MQQSIDIFANRVHSSKPAAAAMLSLAMLGQTGRRTDTVPFHEQYYAGSAKTKQSQTYGTAPDAVHEISSSMRRHGITSVLSPGESLTLRHIVGGLA